MSNEKELSQFRALDFDAEDILFSSLVRYHFEREAAEDLEKLNAGEFDAMPEETDSARKRAEKYYHRERRLRTLRHGYRVMQKVSVFLIVLIVGFTYLTISVDAVKKNVIKWLQETNPSFTSFSFYNDGDTISEANMSTLKVGWIPKNCRLNDENKELGIYSIMIKDTEIADIWYLPTTAAGNIDTEDATISYITLDGFSKVMLIEKDAWHGIQATTSNAMIYISTTTNDIYTISMGELLSILQSLDF